jgi:hypothetical protein
VAVRVTCPRCRSVLEFSRAVEGERLTCPRCLAEIRDPNPAGDPGAPRGGPGQVTAGPPRCSECDQEVQPSWRLCAYCGNRLGDRPIRRQRPSIEADTRKDTALTGLLLILLGLVGSVGYIMLFCSGAFSSASMETLWNMSLGVGFGMVGVVVVGIVLSARGKDAGANLAGGLLGGLAISAIVVLLIGAFVIYAINDCLKSCGGQANPARRPH